MEHIIRSPLVGLSALEGANKESHVERVKLEGWADRYNEWALWVVVRMDGVESSLINIITQNIIRQPRPL